MNLKLLYLHLTIANPTSISYLKRKRIYMYMAIKDKEKLKNDNNSQRCRLIDSDFMPVACSEIMQNVEVDDVSNEVKAIDFDDNIFPH